MLVTLILECVCSDHILVISESEVKKTLALEETARLESGGLAINATSASGFLILGLELEDVQ